MREQKGRTNDQTPAYPDRRKAGTPAGLVRFFHGARGRAMGKKSKTMQPDPSAALGGLNALATRVKPEMQEQPCEARSVPRCKWHGGCSTGPRTPEGKARALANLRQFRQPSRH